MTTITASQVKALRDETGAGMMDCKRALAENDGDPDKARDWLRKRGQAIADKKSSREATEGLIGHKLSSDGKVGVIMELNCETDFVARTEGFQALLAELLDQALAGGAGIDSNDVEQLLAAPSARQPGKTVAEILRENVAKLGENLALGGFVRVEVAGPTSRLESYIHPPGKLGVLVEVSAGKAETLAAPVFLDLCRNLAMHVTAASPEYLTRDDVPAEAIEHERAIFSEQAAGEGKPEKIIAKIVEGKINKYLNQSCLLGQEFVMDSDFTISALLKARSEELGDEVRVVRFVRMKVGG